MKKIFTLSVLALSFVPAFSFDWPLPKLDTEKITTYFSQNEGSQMGTFITIKDTEEVNSSDGGNTILVMEDSNDDTDFFPSTLGSAVIIRHDDNLISVYSNLDKESIKTKDYTTELQKGTQISNTGSSGYKKDEKSVGFQIIDVREKKAINPLILLPQPNQIPPLSISRIVIKNKNGTTYEMQYAKSFAAGAYKLYFRRNELAVPFKTTVLINGEQTDEISFTSLNQEGGKTNVLGKRNYSSEEIYPDGRLMLAGEAVLKPGKATISLIFTDIRGNQRQLNYSVTVH